MECIKLVLFSGKNLGGSSVDELLHLLNHVSSAAAEIDKHGRGGISNILTQWIVCIGKSFVSQYEDAFKADLGEADSMNVSGGLLDMDLDSSMSRKVTIKPSEFQN